MTVKVFQYPHSNMYASSDISIALVSPSTQPADFMSLTSRWRRQSQGFFQRDEPDSAYCLPRTKGRGYAELPDINAELHKTSPQSRSNIEEASLILAIL
jgi:hypothetical protein